VEQLDDADAVLAEGLRVGRRVAVGFVNQAFWLNRLNVFFKGRRTVNEVYPKHWYESLPTNSFSVTEFEDYCDARKIVIEDRVYLSGDWRSECSRFPNLMAGYAIYDLSSID
jgi:methionine biosynthesis protein MetW